MGTVAPRYGEKIDHQRAGTSVSKKEVFRLRRTRERDRVGRRVVLLN